MVKTELLTVGKKVRMINSPHVRGVIVRLKPLGQKNWFNVKLDSGSIQMVQKPELWEFY